MANRGSAAKAAEREREWRALQRRWEHFREFTEMVSPAGRTCNVTPTLCIEKTMTVEETVHVRVPHGCRLGTASFATEDPAVLARIAAEHPDGRYEPDGFVSWGEQDVHVQVTLVPRREQEGRTA